MAGRFATAICAGLVTFAAMVAGLSAALAQSRATAPAVVTALAEKINHQQNPVYDDQTRGRR